ncbi:MAG: 23S rRNA (adenine(2030)-N(6))-methyltransferase RlmJ [Alphaproteobacteria bacterium]|nr:MAG: 23S rRNA (adenine(2030)-N(6))-methyltransferase RlmJ [Alphaproteobacteria bacterium]
MNYRHAFHAGNHADVLKHITLLAVIRRMQEKPAGVQFLDTHAGSGVYDLHGSEASRTGEAAGGVLAIAAAAPADLKDYLEITSQPSDPKHYPGSPELIRRCLRQGDRLIACDLHPEEHQALRQTLGRDARVSVHLRDGYEALGAFLPPRLKRSLVLIDPPYESSVEAQRVAAALRTAWLRFPSGVYLVWYPITAAVRTPRLLAEIAGSGVQRVLQVSMTLASAPTALVGSGVLIVNPPWQLEASLGPQLATAAAVLGGTVTIHWLVPEPTA